MRVHSDPYPHAHCALLGYGTLSSARTGVAEMSNDRTTEMYRCNDMALVSYLKMNSHSVQRSWWDQDEETVYWEFYKTPSLMDCVEKFTNGEALVEPREYNKQFQHTKRELYTNADPHRH